MSKDLISFIDETCKKLKLAMSFPDPDVLQEIHDDLQAKKADLSEDKKSDSKVMPEVKVMPKEDNTQSGIKKEQLK